MRRSCLLISKPAIICYIVIDRRKWATSSAGRALRSQCRGRGFDPPVVHQIPLVDPTISCRGELRPPETRCRHPQQNPGNRDRKSTRLNSSHLVISYAAFCLKDEVIRKGREGAIPRMSIPEMQPYLMDGHLFKFAATVEFISRSPHQALPI